MNKNLIILSAFSVVLVFTAVNSVDAACWFGFIGDCDVVGARQIVPDEEPTGPNEYFLRIDESVKIDGKIFTLLEVSSTATVVSVDGVTEVISLGNTEFINGLEVTLKKVFPQDERKKSAALFIIVVKEREEEIQTSISPMYLLFPEEKISVFSKIVSLVEVGTKTAILDVDGKKKVISEHRTEFLNGLYVTVIELNSWDLGNKTNITSAELRFKL